MRKTILMILIAAALGSYVWFYEIKGGEERDKEKAASEKLFNFEKDSINHISVKTFFSEFEFRKTEDGWRIISPVQTGADKSSINTLLSGLASAKKERSFAVSPEERPGFGLDQRALHVRLNGNNLDAEILIGDPTSVGSNVYASTGDSLVSIISESVKTNAQKTLFDWRDKKALHFKKDDVREIQLKSPNGTFVFVKDADDWKITKPLQVEADNSTVEALINKLDWGKVTAVVSETDAEGKKYGLKKPGYQIILLSGSEKTQTSIKFSHLTDNTAYGKDNTRPHIFQVDSTFMQPFNKKLFDFRNKTLVKFEKDLVNRISFTHEANHVEVVKDTSGTWVLASGDKVKIWKITNLLSTVSDLKAKKFLDGKLKRKSGLNSPSGNLILYAGNDDLLEILIGKKSGELVYVKNVQSGQAAMIDATELDKLLPSLSELIQETKEEDNT